MFDGNRYSISATNLLNHQGYAFWQVNVDRNHHHSYYHIMFSLDSNRPRVENYPTYKINNEPTVYIEEIAYKKIFPIDNAADPSYFQIIANHKYLQDD